MLFFGLCLWGIGPSATNQPLPALGLCSAARAEPQRCGSGPREGSLGKHGQAELAAAAPRWGGSAPSRHVYSAGSSVGGADKSLCQDTGRRERALPLPSKPLPLKAQRGGMGDRWRGGPPQRLLPYRSRRMWCRPQSTQKWSGAEPRCVTVRAGRCKGRGDGPAVTRL